MRILIIIVITVLTGSSFVALCLGAPQIVEVPIIVTDTFGNLVKQYRVEIAAEGAPNESFESPRTLKLPLSPVSLKISASLHRSVKQDIDVSATLGVIIVGLVRPTGSEITGEGSPANPSVRISVGPVVKGTTPVVLRVLGVYSSYSKQCLVMSPQGEVEVNDLPFGEYRAFLFENGRVTKEFELVNEEFKPIVFVPITKSRKE